MTNENEDTRKENRENKPGEEATWLGHIEEEIKEEIEELKDEVGNIDVDFPLSGGAGPNIVHDHHLDKPKEEEDHPDKKSSFLHDLDTEFPLSGGEV